MDGSWCQDRQIKSTNDSGKQMRDREICTFVFSLLWFL